MAEVKVLQLSAHVFKIDDDKMCESPAHVRKQACGCAYADSRAMSSDRLSWCPECAPVGLCEAPLDELSSLVMSRPNALDPPPDRRPMAIEWPHVGRTEAVLIRLNPVLLVSVRTVVHGPTLLRLMSEVACCNVVPYLHSQSVMR